MTRGTAFLRARVGMLGLPTLPEEQGRRARMIGNALRELDHFLNILVEATQIVPARHRLADRHNTARQWRDLQRSRSLSESSYPRLRALGRSRACLFHCFGIVRRADARDGAWMTAGWSSDGNTLDRVPLGEALSPSPAHLLDTCRFYDGIASDLVVLRPIHMTTALA